MLSAWLWSGKDPPDRKLSLPPGFRRCRNIPANKSSAGDRSKLELKGLLAVSLSCSVEFVRVSLAATPWAGPSSSSRYQPLTSVDRLPPSYYEPTLDTDAKLSGVIYDAETKVSGKWNCMSRRGKRW